MAVALARNSSHPISLAIANIAAEQVEVSDWQEVRGSGVEAILQPSTSNPRQTKATARLGSVRWLREAGVDLAAGEPFVSDWSQQGATIIGVAVGENLLGLFAVRDAVKPNAAKVVRRLHSQGLKLFLVTGDNPLTAASIAGQVGIAPENVFAEARPERKAEFVKQLQAQGERVAFVGDGINDAPALAAADVGMAMAGAGSAQSGAAVQGSRGTDAAMQAASITLLRGDLRLVAQSIAVSRATHAKIRQNLAWALVYNLVGIPLAACGLLSPVVAGGAMAASSVSVLLNALTLRRALRRPL